jgi:PKHD-type hydroxylase
MNYLITKFIEEKDLPLFSVDAISDEWRDGINSIQVPYNNTYTEEDILNIKKSLKNNLQCQPNPFHFLRLLDDNQEWSKWCAAQGSTDPLVTRTGVGGYYRPHHDSVHKGDFSTTLFLNDPSEYDGGDLCLWINGKEEKFKLEAGYGITYETGTPHCVNEVTRGERQVAVFWTKSYISELQDLYDFRYYNMMAEKYSPRYDIVSLEDFVNNPHSHFAEKANSILRKHLAYKFKESD